MKSIFEQISGAYTLQGDYRCLISFYPPKKNAISAYGDGADCDIRSNAAKSCITICSLPANSMPTLPIQKKRHKLSFLGL